MILQTASVTELIQIGSSTVLALFTVVLAVATWKYYVQAKEQTEEMEKTRKLQYNPQMKAGLKPYHGPNFCMIFTNIGHGIAQNVQAEYWVEGMEEFKRNWGSQIHFPEDQYLIGLPLDDSEIGISLPPDAIKAELEGDSDQIVVKWKYENIDGEQLCERQKFSISDNLDMRTESTEFYAGNEREVSF